MTTSTDNALPPFYLNCRHCGYREPYDEPRPCCPQCGSGWLDASYDYDHARQQWQTNLNQRPATLWRYGELLPVRDEASKITFGEGWTPLIRAENLGLMLGHNHLYIKDERQGPTGSFKDRQAAIAVSTMKAAGIREAVVASTGNVAIAYSAYCARAGIKLWVFVTSSVPSDKMREVALYGSEVIKVAGTYDQAKQIAAEFAASRNIFLDRGVKAIAAKEAMKTMAYEIAEQLGAVSASLDPMNTTHTEPWHAPDWFVQAISGGMGPVGVMQGFADLNQMGLVDKMPKLGLFQVVGCAPMAEAFRRGLTTAVETHVAHPATDIATLATGIPGEAYEVLYEYLQQHGGLIEAVTDSEAFRALKVVAQMDGVSVEPATAVAFAGLFNLIRNGTIQPHETVVINASGHTFPVEKHIVGERYSRDMNLDHLSQSTSQNDPREDGLLRALEALDDRVKRIAIVEDNPDATRLIRRILQSQGNYFIDEATNGEEGLALILETRPNLVILDLMMPGLDGFSVVDTMKNNPHLRDIPIIVITAKELTPIEKRRLSGKIKGLLQKGSFMDVDLLRDIQEVLP
ncbi:MAG: pyridoxal-phosphate dependent enzyme [Anaerolineales bacterium]|nr:pyridoxal-phosphate dependent enzyme [Anaerolineales bacterium]